MPAQNVSMHIEETVALRRKLARYRTAFLALAFALAAVLAPIALRFVHEQTLGWSLTRIDPKAPQASAIKKLVEPLRYSGIPIILRKDFSLSINVKEKTWTAHNIHRFSEDGSILLEQGRYGLCGDLATYLHDPVRALFDDAYRVQLVRVSQAQFFPAPISAHYVLRIAQADKDKEEDPRGIYILDPSLKRYGPLADFEDYLFFDPKDRLEFARKRNPDETFHLGQGTPLVLRPNLQVGLVISADGRQFDAEHYRLILGVTRPYHYTARTLLLIRRRGARVEVIEQSSEGSRALGKQDYQQLRDRVLELFRGLRIMGG